ncbi:MAG: Glycosyl transferase family 2 [Candidatus Woesebacteria bacterium GW2011_GWA1_39_21]|uniref:Glycosyl transferase family 2 n=1 Tax=Candidatus Woesebacteria bacterium GW2011_GWA1_39_21 TaxID=1618550 RepID=A0A0G0NF45_9BACT|nr:MAG: Glycosyl transferase family 2 [Candidatus Woesebacteria bacterium GW2011_GWA1_39_21]
MISVVINTLNEEKNLPRVLDSVKNFADEIVVVDMYSDDDTVVLAKKAGAKVYQHKRMGYVEPARNYAIEKATGDWILILDADEEIPKSLTEKLKKLVETPKSYDYFRVPRKNIIFGKWIKHSNWWPDYNIRFFKKGFVSWNEIIHSVPVTCGNGADLEVDEKNAIVHHNYSTIEQYIDRLNRYSSHQKTALLKGGYKFTWKDLIREPMHEFLRRYFQGEGYKDGLHGLSLSLLQAFSELTVYLKVWQEEKFKDEKATVENVTVVVKESQREMNYWVADTLYKIDNSLVQKIKRRFRLS